MYFYTHAHIHTHTFLSCIICASVHRPLWAMSTSSKAPASPHQWPSPPSPSSIFWSRRSSCCPVWSGRLSKLSSGEGLQGPWEPPELPWPQWLSECLFIWYPAMVLPLSRPLQSCFQDTDQQGSLPTVLSTKWSAYRPSRSPVKAQEPSAAPWFSFSLQSLP